ncbi:MAG: cob(I)yrinic acid a,c-diamide adenosyltransferase [Proteobacteria bacterium]|nr:cob(I)yrinic acid a,c-diamide adenosyltransferase [Pseudomonadota bacterium]
MARLQQGLVQVYTGSGKGKTTAALGLALRAVGHGLRVCFVQFMKSDRSTGERAAAARLHPELEIHVFSAPHWGDRSQASKDTPWWNLPPSDEDKKQAGEGLLFAQRALSGGEYDIVVLDEVFGALARGLISLDQVMGLIRTKSTEVELILTGRDAPPEVIESADLVTEMNAVKHPYERGVSARKGIEY